MYEPFKQPISRMPSLSQATIIDKFYEKDNNDDAVSAGHVILVIVKIYFLSKRWFLNKRYVFFSQCPLRSQNMYTSRVYSQYVDTGWASHGFYLKVRIFQKIFLTHKIIRKFEDFSFYYKTEFPFYRNKMTDNRMSSFSLTTVQNIDLFKICYLRFSYTIPIVELNIANTRLNQPLQS